MKFLSVLLAALLFATPALADSTISGLNSGSTVQTQDQIPVYRPSNPGTNFRVNIGSAGTQSIGTSGPTVPLLSAANTWSGLQSFLSGDLTAADPVFTGGSLLLPAGTTSQRPGTPVNGMIRYNSTTPGVEGYVNGAWGPLGGSSTSGITALTGDLTASGSGSVASTLATVNANVGTFGTASAVPQITIDAKGRVTGVASVSVTPAAIGAAPLASPTFTGTVTAPVIVGALTGNASTATALAATPSQCTGSQFATGITASGTANCATPSGTGSGVSTFNTRAGAVVPATGDYTVSQVTGAAPLASPTFTGPVNGANAVWSSTDTALNFAATGNGADTLPAGTTAQRPSASVGMVRYNSSLGTVEAYIGSSWQSLLSGLVNLASGVTGILPQASGGTGVPSAQANGTFVGPNPISGATAEYPMTEGTGTVINDISGNGNTANFCANAPTWTTWGLTFNYAGLTGQTNYCVLTPVKTWRTVLYHTCTAPLNGTSGVSGSSVAPYANFEAAIGSADALNIIYNSHTIGQNSY